MLVADQTDVLRSLRLWLAQLLPEPWDLQYERVEIERPAGFVIPTTPKSNTGSAYIRQHSRDFDIFLYPPGFEGEPAHSRVEAERLAHFIDETMSRGFRGEAGYVHYAMRLPVYDYADVLWNESLPDDATPFDFLPVSSFDVNSRVDPDDDTLFTVVASLRVSWTTDGDTRRFEGPLLQDVSLFYREDIVGP